MKRRSAVRHVWRKLASAKWEDAWVERLAFVRDRLAITLAAGGRMMRIEVYGLARAEAQRLQRAFGGRFSIQPNPAPSAPSLVRAPIRIRAKLLIVNSALQTRGATAPASSARTLYIPAGMAFGTGDHATTASCLRLLADVSGQLKDVAWEMIDLGTGSGILAIAGRALGAHRVKACDFDPDAVRVARENIRRNGIDHVTAVRIDVRRWEPARRWNVVVANLYSDLLIEVVSKIARALGEPGYFIFSGILRQQEQGVLAALVAERFRIVRLVRRGKWVAGLAEREGT